MDLRAVRVEGFRGLRCLDVELSPLTVLLGETRVGKTTFLDALEACLGLGRRAEDCPFDAGDFSVDEDGGTQPITVTLHFAGDPGDAMLEELAWKGKGGERHVVLRLRATKPESASWAFLGAEDEVLIDQAPPSVCDRLRALHPVLHLDVDRYADTVDDGAPEQGPEQVPGMFRRLFRRRGSLSPNEVREGLELLRMAISPSEDMLPAIPRATTRLREIVNAPGRLRAFPEQIAESLHSAGSQSLALFLLVAFLLEVREGETLAEGAVPILLIEQPELRLHPTVAASLWGILELLPGQKVITTNSPVLLSAAPLSDVRRLTRRGDDVQVHRLHRKTLDFEDLRRIAFHLRLQQGMSLFARCWLLVEGESEVWLLTELARTCGYVLATEGVACLTFAQCGLEPILRLARDFGISWYMLADGDEAGVRYTKLASQYLAGRAEGDHITRLPDKDIEHYMWNQGYADVFRRAAGDLVPKKQRRRRRGKGARRGFQTPKVIRRAIRGASKPGLALRVAVAASRTDGPGVPTLIRAALDAAVRLARTAAISGEPKPS